MQAVGTNNPQNLSSFEEAVKSFLTYKTRARTYLHDNYNILEQDGDYYVATRKMDAKRFRIKSIKTKNQTPQSVHNALYEMVLTSDVFPNNAATAGVLSSAEQLNWVVLPELLTAVDMLRIFQRIEDGELAYTYQLLVGIELYLVYDWFPDSLDSISSSGRLSGYRLDDALCQIASTMKNMHGFGLALYHRNSNAQSFHQPDLHSVWCKAVAMGDHLQIVLHARHSSNNATLDQDEDIHWLGLIIVEMMHRVNYRCSPDYFWWQRMKCLTPPYMERALRLSLKRKFPNEVVLREVVLQILCTNPNRRPSIRVIEKILSNNEEVRLARIAADVFYSLLGSDVYSPEEMIYSSFYQHFILGPLESRLNDGNVPSQLLAKLRIYLDRDFPLLKLWQEFNVIELEELIKVITLN